MGASKEFDIIAGDGPEEIADYICADIKNSFCSSQEEFADEWDGREGAEYRVTINIQKIVK